MPFTLLPIFCSKKESRIGKASGPCRKVFAEFLWSWKQEGQKETTTTTGLLPGLFDECRFRHGEMYVI